MKPWNEEEHPRDEKGRFTEKIRAVLSRGYELPLTSDGSLDIYRFELLYGHMFVKEHMQIPLGFFGRQDGNDSPVQIPAPPTRAYGFASAKRRDTEHHIDHARQMGYKNQKEYQRAACEFWEHGEGTVYYSIGRKNFVKIERGGLTGVMVSVDGIVSTFFIH